MSLSVHILQVFRPRTPPEALDLVSRLLEYTPSSRITPMEACAHPFFNELRQPGTRMPNGKDFPPLYNFTPQGRRGTSVTLRLDWLWKSLQVCLCYAKFVVFPRPFGIVPPIPCTCTFTTSFIQSQVPPIQTTPIHYTSNFSVACV